MSELESWLISITAIITGLAVVGVALGWAFHKFQSVSQRLNAALDLVDAELSEVGIIAKIEDINERMDRERDFNRHLLKTLLMELGPTRRARIQELIDMLELQEKSSGRTDRPIQLPPS